MLTCWLIITKRKANMSVIYRMSGIIRKESIKFKVKIFVCYIKLVVNPFHMCDLLTFIC